jgi:intraflagellar transport protein 88
MSFKPSFNFGSKNNSNEEDDEYSFGGSSLDPTSQFSHTQHLKQPLVGAQKVSNPYLPPQTGRIGGITNRQSDGRLMTAQGTIIGKDGQRPMTSVRAVGYSSNKKSFDPLQQHRGPAPPLEEKSDSSPEEQAKKKERKVHDLVEKSAAAAHNGDSVMALERAKEAGKKEKQLCKFREKHGLSEGINLDLTYSVCFNLASMFHMNKMYGEALNTYQLIVKNKQYPQAGRLRVNMGNIYYEQKKYANAIKMYRMAMDQIPNTSKEIRFKIRRNIGVCSLRQGNFADAIDNFETVLENAKPEDTGFSDFLTPFNLLVCYYAVGDSNKMKRTFTRLISVPLPGSTDEDEEEEKSREEDTHEHKERDPLRVEVVKRQKSAKRLILIGAKLIAPYIDPREWVSGYEWLIESLKQDYPVIASEMEIKKAVTYLRMKQFDKAIEVFKSFEKKDHALKAKAATNLSFLYFLEQKNQLADKYANLAVRYDRYNAKALVNKGNCLYASGEYEKAKELYLESIGVEADCVEAIYNLGLVNKKIGVLNESLQAFEKLHTIVPDSPEVIYQIANLYDLNGDIKQAIEWFKILLTSVPSDPGAQSRLGQIYTKDNEESDAFHHHNESYRYYPVNLDVISWLGVWFVKSEMYEKAIHFFQRAAEIQPKEVKWRLMVTSCYRRMGQYQEALELYEKIHSDYPENLECLRYLVAICKDLGHKYDHYQQSLAKLERAAAAKTGGGLAGGILTQMNPQQQQQQGGGGRGGGRGGGHQTGPEHGGGGGGRRQQQQMPPPIREESNEQNNNNSNQQKPRNFEATGQHGNLQSQRRKNNLDDSDEFDDADIDDLLA